MLIIRGCKNDLAMVAKTSDSCRECFSQLRRLHKMRDHVNAASGYCISNLEIIHSLQTNRGGQKDNSPSFSTAEIALQGYIKSTKLLRDQIDNTINLVSLTQL